MPNYEPLITVLITLVIVAFLALSIARSISRPVQDLATGTQIIGKGDLTHRVGTDDKDEVGILSRAIDKMAVELETLIDELRQSESEVRALNESLEQRVETRTAELARSNSELDAFAYVASHDLKAPLRAIDNLANWVSEDAVDGLPEKSREHLKKMRRRVRRMESLLDDMLQYSRAGRVNSDAEDVATGELVAEVVDMLAPPDGFDISIGNEMPVIRADRAPLRQVFLNLIANAIKHHDRSEGHVEVVGRDGQDFVEFSIADDGPGIPSEYHDRVFKIFQTLRPRDEVEGSGMGLAVVKKV